MDAITMFKEAAVALQSDMRVLALDAARRAVDQDQELQDKIGQFNLTRMDMNNEMTKDERDDDRIDALNDKINKLWSEIMNHTKMIEFNNAQADCQKIVEHVQAIVETALNGGDPMLVQEPQGGCTGSCSTCAGCH